MKETNLIEEEPKKELDLTDEEILEAKENCFILLGKTGTGKTSLLNLIYGWNIGKVGYESKSETKTSSCYCIKKIIDSKKICFSIIDTPGLYDSDGREKDKIMKDFTKELISNENLKIKGILFLSNFQNERFDYSEIDSLFQYNVFFPLKNFWKHIMLIFTHYYGDPDGDSKEEIKENADKNLNLIFMELMEKIKEVSTPRNFYELERLYVNIHSKIKNEIQKKDNEIYKNQILEKIYKFCQFEPMYNKFCLFKFKNIEVEKYKEFLFDSKLELFLNINNKILNKKFEMINMTKKGDTKEKNQIELNFVNSEINENGKLINKTIIKTGSLSDFKISLLGGGIVALSFIGFSLIGVLSVFGLFGGVGLIIKNINDVSDQNKEMDKKKDKIMRELNIKDLIEEEIIKYIKTKFN